MRSPKNSSAPTVLKPASASARRVIRRTEADGEPTPTTSASISSCPADSGMSAMEPRALALAIRNWAFSNSDEMLT